MPILQIGSKPKKGPRLIDWFLCDDIRREATGKLIYIGVYEDAIVVPGVPINLTQLILSSKWDISNGQIEEFELNVTRPDGSVLGPIGGKNTAAVEGDTRKKASINIAFSPLVIESAGEFTFSAKVNGEPCELGTFMVLLAAPPQMQQ